VCDICEIATVLDPASATELLSMYPIGNAENHNPKHGHYGFNPKGGFGEPNFPLQQNVN